MSRAGAARPIAVVLALSTWMASSGDAHAQDATEYGSPAALAPLGTPPQIRVAPRLFAGDSGVGGFGLIALRVASTVVDGQNGVDREVDAVGAGLGARLHLLGTANVPTWRAEIEIAAGANRDGLDGIGHVAFTLGAATHLAEKDALLFRLGADARAFGNASFDFEMVQAPVVDLAFQHHGDEWFLDVGPTGGLALATHAGAGASAERDLGLAGVGGVRGLFGVAPLWVGLDYAAVVEDDVTHLAGGSICITPNGISGCLDVSFVAIDAFAGEARNAYSIRAAYAGLALGIGGCYHGN